MPHNLWTIFDKYYYSGQSQLGAGGGRSAMTRGVKEVAPWLTPPATGDWQHGGGRLGGSFWRILRLMVQRRRQCRHGGRQRLLSPDNDAATIAALAAAATVAVAAAAPPPSTLPPLLTPWAE